MAMFSIKTPHHPFIDIRISEYFHKRDKSFPSSFFDARSPSLIHVKQEVNGVSNLLQLPNLSLVPLVRRNFRWTNEVTLFQPSVPLARENLSYYSPNFWTEESQTLAIDNSQVRRYTPHKLLGNFKHKLITFKSKL